MFFLSVLLGLIVLGAHRAGKRSATEFKIVNETDYHIDITIDKKRNKIVITNIEERA